MNLQNAWCNDKNKFILKITVLRQNCRETPRQNHDVTLTATCRGCGAITAFECPKHYAENTGKQRFSLDICIHYAAARDSVNATATVRAGLFVDRLPVRGETFIAPVRTRPGAHSASCTMNTGSLSRGKAAGACR